MEVIDRGGLHAVKFAPRQLRVYFDHIGPGANTVRLHTWHDALPNLPGALAMLDGPMYAALGGGKADMLFAMRDPSSGEMPGSRAGQGMVLNVTAEGAAVWTPRPLEGAPVVVQGYPPLVRSGSNVTTRTLNTSRETRAGIGETRDGQLFLAVGPGSMTAFADQLMRDLDAVNAVYTDGGGSGKEWRQGNAVGNPEDRAVASWLWVAEDAGGTVGDQASGAGRTLGVVLVGLAGAALVGAALSK